MTRTAVVSDIHGNLPALEAVVADARARGCDRFVNLGDCLSGPLWPADTADFLIAQAWPTIAGNHERQLAGPRKGMAASDAFAAAALTDAHWAWLRALPAALVIDGMRLCHGTPGSDVEHLLFTVSAAGIALASDQDIRDRVVGTAERMIWCGHTHLPALRSIEGHVLINPGSVGLQAFDDDRPYPYAVENGDPMARYAIAEDGAIELITVAYDHLAAARKAAAEGFDNWSRWLATGCR